MTTGHMFAAAGHMTHKNSETKTLGQQHRWERRTHGQGSSGFACP